MSIDPAAVVAAVESNGNTLAIRFEPALDVNWTAKLTPPAQSIVKRIIAANGCSTATAIMIACTSWGAFQLLGENLYDPHIGLDYAIGTYLGGGRLIQEESFEKFCAWRGISLPVDFGDDQARVQFAVLYNGPGNVIAYSARLFNAFQLLGGVA